MALKSSDVLDRLRRRAGSRASPGERVLGALFPSRGIGWPGGWSQDRLEQVLHFRNWRYVAIHTICCKIAQTTPNLGYLHTNTIPGKTQKFIKALSVVKPHEDVEPLEYDHPLRRLIENPNPIDTSFDLLYEGQMFLELCGVNYTWMVPNEWGVPCELWTIPAHWVWPRTGGAMYVPPDHPDADRLIQYYEIRPWGGMGSAGMLRFPPDEVMMERWKNPMNKIDGWSSASAGAQWIDTEESIIKSRWSQMMNSARPEFHVELGEGYTDPDDDMIARIESKFMAKYVGEYNYGKPIFTPPGTKVTPLSFSPTEMAYFQSEEQSRDMLLSLSSVPGAAVGLTKDLTFGSVLATLASFCTFGVNPRLVMRGLTWNKFLAPRFRERGGPPIKLWWDDCVPHDPEQINADIAQDFASGAITPNEIRAMRGRKPYNNGGDDPLLPGPGGTIPLPLNTGEDQTELADLVPNLGASQETAQEGGPGGMPGAPGAGGDEGAEDKPAGEGSLDEQINAATVDEPNGKPTKRLNGYWHRNGNGLVKNGSYFSDCPRDELGYIVLKTPENNPNPDLERFKDRDFSHGRQFKVKLVDAVKLRDESTDFEEFGNVGTHVEFDSIPFGEVWISNAVEKEEIPYFIANGERQLRVITGPHTVDEAVSAGLTAEKFERDKNEPREYRVANTDDCKVRKLTTIKDHDEEVDVWLVRGRVVRDTFETPFTEGANNLALSYVPSGEIWVEEGLDPDEYKFIVLHERVERCLMKHSYLTYDEAHAEASRIEFIIRGKTGVARHEGAGAPASGARALTQV